MISKYKKEPASFWIRVWGLSLIFIQFPWHSRFGDDWPNSQIMKYAEWRYGSVTPGMFFTITWNGVLDWIHGQGRFFPVAAFQNQLTLFFFKSDRLLAIFYGIFMCIVIYLWSEILVKITNQIVVGTTFIAVMPIFMRFRFDFDPHIGFTQLVLWAFFWASCSLYFAIKATSVINKSRLLNSLISGLFMFIALCQYELSIFFVPTILILILAILKDQNKLTIRNYFEVTLLPLVFSTSYLVFVFGVLRPKANPSGNYVSGFEFYKSLRIFLNSIFSGLPLFGINFQNYFLLPKYESSLIILTVCLILTWMMLFSRVTKFKRVTPNKQNFKKTNNSIDSHESLKTALISVAMLPLILSQSLMLSIQPNWWGIIKFGHSYLGVLFAEFGFATLAAILICRKSK